MAEAYEEKKPDGGQWYVVHTYSGYENKVKVDLEKTIENRQLQDQIFEVSVPTEQVEEIKNGTRKTTDRKLFPGYVLVRMIYNNETWYVVRNTRGVTGFVGPGSKPVPLSPEEMVRLGFGVPEGTVLHEQKVEYDFAEGDTVTASARLLHKGTTLHVWNVDIHDTAGDLISSVRVTNYVIQSKKK